MPSDCSCLPDEVPGADSFVIMCWRGVKNPFFRPLPTTSGCVIKKKMQRHSAHCQRQTDNVDLGVTPFRGGGRLSDYHIDTTVHKES